AQPLEDTATVVRKVLACVARVEEAGKRVGKTMIRHILVGSKRQEIAQLGLDKISTYGLLKTLSPEQIENVIEQLLATGCFQTDCVAAHRPTITLTERGWRVMQGKEQLAINIAVEETPRSERRAPRPDPRGNYRHSLELHQEGKSIEEIA